MKKKVHILLLLLPFLGITALIAVSVWNVAVQSFGYIPAFGLTKLTLRYYAEVFRNPDFASSVWVSLKIALWSAVLACVLGVARLISSARTRLAKMGPLRKMVLSLPESSFSITFAPVISEGIRSGVN